MASEHKYFYMRLIDNFFESENILLLEGMPDGYLYSNLLLKLYLRSLKDGGRLMLNGRIPYSPQMIAAITRHEISTVENALKLFEELGLIEVLDSGAIYMLDIENYIGTSSTETDRKRKYRDRINCEKEDTLPPPTGQTGDKRGTNGGQTGDKRGTNGGQMADKRGTNGGQTADKQRTNDHHIVNSNIDNSNIVSSYSYNRAGARAKETTTTTSPPSKEEVIQECVKRGIPESEGLIFYSYNSARNWTINGQAINDWNAVLDLWILRARDRAPLDYAQRATDEFRYRDILAEYEDDEPGG